jgi:hypothetical protein
VRRAECGVTNVVEPEAKQRPTSSGGMAGFSIHRAFHGSLRPAQYRLAFNTVGER